MSTRLRPLVTPGLLAAVAFLLYGMPPASSAPSPDEVTLLRQAQSLVTTGRDVEGRVLPLFFRAGDEHWLLPMPVYATALVSTVVPDSMAPRLSSAAVGAVNVGLLYLLMRRRYPTGWAPAAAAVLLALTPAHFAFAQSGLDSIYSLPFVLFWLIGLWDFLKLGQPPRLAAGAFALGVGVFSQPSAPLTMGFLWIISLAALWASGTRSRRAYGAAAAGFVLPLLATAFWFASYPESYPDTFGRWAIHAAHLRNPLDGLRAFMNWTTLGTRTSLYWGFFDPSWLFFGGPAAPGLVLQGSAPFLFPTVLFLALGVSRSVRVGPAPWTLALLTGLAVTPLAASTFGEPHAIGSALAVLPFAMVLAGSGLVDWSERTGAAWRWLGWAAIAALALECSSRFPAYFAR